MNQSQFEVIRQVIAGIDQERDELSIARIKAQGEVIARGGVGAGHQPRNTDIPPS